MAELTKSKSTGGCYHTEWSPCISLMFRSFHRQCGGSALRMQPSRIAQYPDRVRERINSASYPLLFVMLSQLELGWRKNGPNAFHSYRCNSSCSGGGAAAAFRIYWVVALWKEEIGSASAGAGFKEVVGDQKTIEHHYIYPSTSHGNAVSL